MTDHSLGSLERLHAREVWKNEAYDFTPWLRANIALLGQTLGIEVDPEMRQEVAVGLFTADLGSTSTQQKKFSSSASRLSSYELTDRSLRLTSKSLSLRTSGRNRSGFEQQRVEEAGAPSERNERYRDFWTTVVAAIRERQPDFTTTSPERAPRQSWCAFSLGRTGVLNNVAFGWESVAVLRTEIYIDTGDRGHNKAIFDALHADKEAIEAEYGEPLVLARRDDVKHSRIYVKRPGGLDDSSELLAEYREWFVENALRMKRVFSARVKAVALSPGHPPVDLPIPNE